MSEAILSSAASIVISLVLAYLPGVREQWDKLTGRGKRLGIAVIMLIVAAVSVTFGCTGVFAQFATDCSQSGIERAIIAYLGALLAGLGTSQATYVYAIDGVAPNSAEAGR